MYPGSVLLSVDVGGFVLGTVTTGGFFFFRFLKFFFGIGFRPLEACEMATGDSSPGLGKLCKVLLHY